ncbi:uncharacterized protein LOC128991504 [Macrosteles quadrilineatus]|uniref:uncharacterized protein LOC128991504 n=1 Tax=Macrosteles quadrilineatus TaxID=74068 RepID=UPI0023E335A0|nr:uncharacterized protein LOC128991504 [Macrosteles quadrilineatus]
MVNSILLFVLVFAGQSILVLGELKEYTRTPEETVALTNSQIDLLRSVLEIQIGWKSGVNTNDEAQDKNGIKTCWNGNQKLISVLVHNCVRRDYMEKRGWLDCDGVKNGLLNDIAIQESKVKTWKVASGDSTNDSQGKFETYVKDTLSQLIATAFNNCPGGVNTDTNVAILN